MSSGSFCKYLAADFMCDYRDKRTGLPPGPIANPGAGSIQAALTPSATPFLYFVAKADGSGGHTFSESLQQHEAAVTAYRRATTNH